MGSHKKKKKKVTSVENLFITHIRSNSGLFINMKWKAHIYMDITEYNTVKINEIYVFLFPRGKKKKAAGIKFTICFYPQPSLYLINVQEMRKRV